MNENFYYFPPVFIDPRSYNKSQPLLNDWVEYFMWREYEAETKNLPEWPPFLSDPTPRSLISPKHRLMQLDLWNRDLLAEGAVRCVFYFRADNTPSRMFLSFRPNGSGMFVDLYDGHSDFPPNFDLIPFRWKQYSPFLNILTASEIDLEPLCYRVLFEQVLEQMSEPLIDTVVEDGWKSKFICGSMEELWRVTRLIVYTEPGIFQHEEDDKQRGEITVCYESLLAQDHRLPMTDPHYFSPRFHELCKLAFLFNAFTGVDPDVSDYDFDPYFGRWHESIECDYYGVDFEYTGEYDTHPARIEFTFREPIRLEPNRKHIVACSRRQLDTWLRGKVGDVERKRLLYPRRKPTKVNGES